MNTRNTHTQRRIAQTTGLLGLALVLVLNLPNGASHANTLLATAPNLGAAGSFSVLAALSASAAGPGTTISGDLGLSPGLAVSRTGPWTVGGSEHFGPGSLAETAQSDALGAFNDLAGQASSGVWGGATNPVPGVWSETGSPAFAGTLTLNGGPTDVWVFQISTDFTFAGSVVLAGGARACNVFWQVGRDATVAAGSGFIGTLIASRDVTLVAGANVDGRVFSLNGAMTTDGNNIVGPSCPAIAVTETPTVTNTPVPGVTDTPAPGPTETPFIMPTDTPLPPPGDTPIAPPSETPFAPPSETPALLILIPVTGADATAAPLPWLYLGLGGLGLGLAALGFALRRKANH